MNDDNKSGLLNLNEKGTKFPNLPGIVCLNISNLLSEDGEFQPISKENIRAARIATNQQLSGSDSVNLLVQARALLLRSYLVPFVVTPSDFVKFFIEEGTLGKGYGIDITKVVVEGYPKGILHCPEKVVTDQEEILRDMSNVNFAFKHPGLFSDTEKARMVQDFQRALQDLHIAELLIHSDEFKVDSVLFGLDKMSREEILIRSRINTYMENELLKLAMSIDNNVDIKHIETHSLPLDLHGRVEKCTQYYNKYGGGAYLKKGIAYAVSASCNTTLYDYKKDYFLVYIKQFFKEVFG